MIHTNLLPIQNYNSVDHLKLIPQYNISKTTQRRWLLCSRGSDSGSRDDLIEIVTGAGAAPGCDPESLYRLICFVWGLTVSWRNAVIHKTDLPGAAPALPTQHRSLSPTANMKSSEIKVKAGQTVGM